MLFLADFHIHSRYSYATSKTMDLQALALWGRYKGLTVMGTGDFTHPIWQKELQEQLCQVEQGLFALQPEYQTRIDQSLYQSCKGLQRFILTSEISTVFKRNGKCYKIHSIILAPSFSVVKKITARLASIGNINYDGRPMLSLDIKDLVSLVLESSSDCMIIPAHIWTPHFGLLGYSSGFDSFQECFQELTPYIYAFEKGLSSNFLMNAMVSNLDRFAILSNSDAHSLENLGREANLFDTDFSYQAITQAIRNNDPEKLVAGIEFYPEMGKYYGSGHRACSCYLTPEESLVDRTCLICGKGVTIGVAHRVAQLADRTREQALEKIRPSHAIVPLQTIIAYTFNVQLPNKKVQAMYHHLLISLGNEFYILLQAPIEQVMSYGSLEIAQAIKSMRSCAVMLTPGYDGFYGTIKFL